MKRINLSTLKILIFNVLFLVTGIAGAQPVEDLLAEADKNKIVNPEKFQQVLQKIEKNQSGLSESQKDFLEYLSTFTLIAEGEYNKAISKLEDIQKTTNNLIVKVRSLLTLSNIYAFTKHYDKAFTSLDFVTDNLNKITDDELLEIVYLALANSYLLTNQYQLSKKYSSLLLKQELDEVVKCRASVYYYSALLRFNSGEEITSESINKVKKLCTNTDQHVVGTFLELGWIRYFVENNKGLNNRGQWKKIQEQLQNILAETQGVYLKSLELMTLSLLAKTNYKLSDYSQAEENANTVLNSNEVMGDSQPRLDAIEVLKNLAEQQGDFKQAYVYLSELENINNDLIADNQLKELAFLNVKHANTARELEIEQLNKSNEILKIEQQLAKQKVFNQQLLVLLLLIVLGFTTAWLYRIRKRHGVLEKAADLDHLTKIYNRSGFEKWIERWIERAEKNQLELHFSILDFDYFKQINDQYGHLAGDWVLKHVIYEIKKHLDEHMMIGRLGGEEFCLAIIDMPMEEAEEKMEGLRKVVENLDLTGSGFDISITCSFGVTSHYVSGYNLVSLLTHADVALYQAKSAGRNRLIRYQP
jgi:diguanylate cyclase (GGDEF)-like protein